MHCLYRKRFLNSHLGSNPDLCYVQYRVITNHVIKRFRCTCTMIKDYNNSKISCLMTKPTKWLCTQQRLRSAWAFAQSDQSLRCPQEESVRPYLPIECIVKTDQTRWMPRLIWIFAGCRVILLVLSWGGSNLICDWSSNIITYGRFQISLEFECLLTLIWTFHTIFTLLSLKQWLNDIKIWTASSEFGTYRLCEQRRFRRACASAQSRQNLRCSLTQAVSQEVGWLCWGLTSQSTIVSQRNLQTESQIPGPSEWLDMRSWNLSRQNARRQKFAWRGSYDVYYYQDNAPLN